MSETVTLYFPDKKVLWTPSRGTQDKTDIEESGGREQRRARYPLGGRRLMTGDLEFLNIADRAVVRDFVKSVRGSYLPFYIWAWDKQKFTNFQIGVGDGATYNFYAPFYYSGSGPLDGTNKDNAELLDVKVDGVAYHYSGSSEALAYTYTPRGAPYNDFAINFFILSPAPPADKVVTISVIGRERIPVRMQSDKQAETFVRSANILAVRHIDVIEVL